MRVLVVGAGALGALLGALLQEASQDVVLLARGANLRALVLEGLRLDGGAYGPTRYVPVTALPRVPDTFAPDLVVLAVKTQDIEAALKEHAHAFGDAPVVALQNGLQQDALVTAVVGRARAVAGVAALDAEHIKPAEVVCHRRGTLVVGAPWKEGEAAAEKARGILRQAVDVKAAPNVRGARWTKLLLNIGNAIPAVTGLPFQATSRHPELGRAHIRLVREGLAVADEEGSTLAPLPWTSPGLIRAVTRLPEALAQRAYATRVRMVLGRAPAFGSTWQSIERGQSVETDFLNGEVVKRGRALRVPTPVNAAALRLVHEGRRLSADEAAQALLGGA